MSSLSQLKELVERTVELPAMPSVGARVLTHLREPTSSAESVARLIQVDPALSTRLLAVANSSAFASAARVTSVQTAVARIGLSATGSLALALSTKSVFKQFGEVEQELWRHSIACGAAAQLIAAYVTPASKYEAFTAGLLHDVGKYVMVSTNRERFLEVLARCNTGGEAGCDAEHAIFGVNHAEVGGVLMQSWGLPESLQNVALMHHDLQLARSAADSSARLVEVVALADAMVRIGANTDEESQASFDLVRHDLELIDVDDGRLSTIKDRLGIAIAEQQRLVG